MTRHWVPHEDIAMNALDRAFRAMKSDLEVHLLSVFSVGVAFVCLVTALLVVVNVQHVHDRWQHLGKLSVYLQPNVAQDRVGELDRALRATPGVSGVRFVSSDAARRDLMSEHSDDTLAALPEQAFPASLEIDTQESMPIEARERMAQQLRALPGVESIETYANWSSKLTSVFSGGVTAALVLTLIVLGAVVSVVSSTIRMALEKRRAEVEVLKLVGATDSYVRGPFILEGAAQGLLGALFALCLVGALYSFLRNAFEAHLTALLGINVGFLPWTMSAGLLVAGAALGATAAYLSLRRLLVL
jgi:cell division transport system permease protein